MNKKNISRTLGIAAISALVFTSCNNSAPKMDEKQETATAASTTDMKIAFVEVDSIMSQYKYCKEYSLVLQKKSNNARNTLAAKGKQLQTAAANFQQKLQNNGFASREQAASVQAAIQFNKSLRGSIQNFLKDYNKTKKYDLIISKAGDNILYADKKHDITQDVINGLNKRYKSTLKEADKK